MNCLTPVRIQTGSRFRTERPVSGRQAWDQVDYFRGIRGSRWPTLWGNSTIIPSRSSGDCGATARFVAGKMLALGVCRNAQMIAAAAFHHNHLRIQTGEAPRPLRTAVGAAVKLSLPPAIQQQTFDAVPGDRNTECTARSACQVVEHYTEQLGSKVL